MKITLAKTAGFCFGVKRAVDKVYEEISNGKEVYTYGPIIHNDEVVKDLEDKGVKVIHSLDELKKLDRGTIVIRSHGVPKSVLDQIKEIEETEGKNFDLVDATCPYVLKIHRIVKEQSELGRQLIVIGDKEHPEVSGIIGWCKNPVIVVGNAEEAEKIQLSSEQKVCIVAQTTFNYKNFQELVEIISKKGYDILVLNTICNATEERQTEAAMLSKTSEAMIVIGGKHSSNTRKLYEISKKECANTYYIQKLIDLDLNQLKSFRSVGITAGASTPNNIIKEVHTRMAEMSFEQLLEESLVTIHNGEVVDGTVIRVKEDEIVLNIGYKADGILTRNEYTNQPNVDLRTVANEGDTMTVKVLKVNDGEGQVLLTYKRLAAEKGSKRLEEAFNNKEVLKAKVAAVLDGGLSVIVDEARIFIPASLASDTYEKNLDKFKDQEIEFVISEFNPKRRRIIGDRKQLLVAKKQELSKALFAKIKVGDVVEGTVKNVTDFGAFIDLGGADGLLHISEMSWGRIESPKKVFKVGDTVKAFIKDIQGEKIALSLKFPEQNPWANASEKYAVGNVVTGRVARMTEFGAFVELEPGVDALLHVSQISKEHIEKPADALKIGQEVTAKVVDFNNDEKKISLSIKALEAPAAEEATTEE
ncbi:bifunctional 4-hydroxy-3-methylbut-2-enyl diphosphate reductase/30S ribosomal protein S1 [Lachnoclostridium phytofermentans]|uniref:4-hydroxy-3-methylbut-2-enyl diphosphate reductase n=1 Tax=Lachnoclostridium phytofermentans (strain ATCC 700394 / DSM 18823 / ISDg) TaxID=357809 RepID=A9KLR6_LACP7|nr:bifunctional 4-hydroxy-3-methylbut-2-enyl diphosphate reductase/30S ribosomal protein S1 [Lachnoclostridium phytofermentans]ABX42810.1 hydroxymethylbutenyl pyrophosphate reductase [Lachnoclostridium phytofermentans ISDg]